MVTSTSVVVRPAPCGPDPRPRQAPYTVNVAQGHARAAGHIQGGVTASSRGAAAASTTCGVGVIFRSSISARASRCQRRSNDEHPGVRASARPRKPGAPAEHGLASTERRPGNERGQPSRGWRMPGTPGSRNQHAPRDRRERRQRWTCAASERRAPIFRVSCVLARTDMPGQSLPAHGCGSRMLQRWCHGRYR